MADALVGPVAEQSGVVGAHAAAAIGGSIVANDAEEGLVSGLPVEGPLDHEATAAGTVEARVGARRARADHLDRCPLGGDISAAGGGEG